MSVQWQLGRRQAAAHAPRTAGASRTVQVSVPGVPRARGSAAIAPLAPSCLRGVVTSAVPFLRPAAVARLREITSPGCCRGAPRGSGLAWGCWLVAPGPGRAARGRLRACRGRWHASDRCMHAFQTVSRIIEIQSPVSVTASVPVCSYVFSTLYRVVECKKPRLQSFFCVPTTPKS